MPAYSLELYDRDGTALGELPDAQLTDVSWINNDIGQLNFTLTQDDPRALDIILHKHEVRLNIDGWPILGRVPWQGPVVQCKNTDQTATFTASDLNFYLNKRFIDFNSLVYDDLAAGYEQMSIGWGLMQYAQGIPVRNVVTSNAAKSLRVTAGTWVNSGIKRLRRYERNDHQSILELLREFPTLVNYTSGAPNGFEWEFRLFADGRREWWPAYPLLGSVKSDLTLEYGRNLQSFSIDEDATNLVTRAICTGGSTGDLKIENEYNDTTNSAYYGEFFGITSDGDEKDPAELGSKARAFVQSRNHPIWSADLKAARVPVELLGQLFPGDTVPVSIHRGRVQIEQNFRIAGITWQVRPNVLQLKFVPPVGSQSA